MNYRLKFMKLWCVSKPCAIKRIRRLAGIGLGALAAMQASQAWAEEAAKPPVAQAQSAQAAPAPAAPQKPAGAAKAKVSAKPAAAAPAECIRTGQRVIAALARDDTGVASQFFTFYTAFKCSQPHLVQAFGCLVKLQMANPAISNPSPDLVNQCWSDPSMLPSLPPSPPPAEPPH
jgi:hypothetical protein